MYPQRPQIYRLGSFALDNRDGEVMLMEIGINAEHALCFFYCLLGCGVHRMSLLPEKFSRAQERTGCFLPTDNTAPLIIKLRQVAVGFDYICIMIAEKHLGGGAHAKLLGKHVRTAVSYPCNLEAKPSCSFSLLSRLSRMNIGI